MESFWLWFWRPMAEFLGSLALIGSLALLAVVIIFLMVAYDALKKRFSKKSS